MTSFAFVVVSLLEDTAQREWPAENDFGVHGSPWATVVNVVLGDPTAYSRRWGWPRANGEWRIAGRKHPEPYDITVLARVRSPSRSETRKHFISPIRGPRAILMDTWNRGEAFGAIRERIDTVRAGDIEGAISVLQEHFWVDIPDEPGWIDVPLED